MNYIREVLELLLPILRHKHKWENVGWIHDGVPSWTKRRCISCNKEEWLMINSYPSIGEPKYEWKDMTL